MAEAEPDGDGRREVGDDAVWSLSSAKPGNGIDQLRDNNMDTYWQSDGMQPHVINLQFPRKTTVHELMLYLDYKLDESYTPKKIAIRSGNTVHDLKEIHVQHLAEPDGWISMPLYTDGSSEQVPLRTFFLQIAILAMHQNGRDTHVRQVKIYAPREASSINWTVVEAVTPQFTAYSCIR